MQRDQENAAGVWALPECGRDPEMPSPISPVVEDAWDKASTVSSEGDQKAEVDAAPTVSQ